MPEHYPKCQIAGLDLFCINPYEASILAAEAGDYFRHGIDVKAGDVVFDVGANIGAFSALVLGRTGGDVEIYAFEPIPPILEVLRLNARAHFGDRLHVIDRGLGRTSEEIDFSYFPAMTIWSSSHRDASNEAEERKRIKEMLLRAIRDGRMYPHLRFVPELLRGPIVDGLIAPLFRMQTFRCRVQTLSELIEEREVPRIDLLKVDAEGAELAILQGIEDADWPKVRSVVLEAERFTAAVPAITALLEARGFRVITEQDGMQRAGDTGMVFAKRLT